MRQPVEQRLLTDAVERLQRSGRFSVVFGGLPARRGIEITAIRGNRFDLLGGLHVGTERGLGGRAIAERRARVAHDYRTSRHITHDYDREVLSEQIRTLLAVPVLVDGRVRGVLYGGSRRDGEPGSIAVRPAVAAAAELARELAVADRVVRIAGDLESGAAPPVARSATDRVPRPGASGPTPLPAPLPAAQLEEVRASYAELRSIASTVRDPALRDRLQHLEDRLVRLAAAPDASGGERVHLSPRETDVLGYVAVGRTSADIADELGLAESTVKSYLATAMRKLGARTRHEAVGLARRQGLLP